MPFAGAAVTAMPAGDVALAADAVAHGKASHGTPHFFHHTTELMAHNHGHGT